MPRSDAGIGSKTISCRMIFRYPGGAGASRLSNLDEDSQDIEITYLSVEDAGWMT